MNLLQRSRRKLRFSFRISCRITMTLAALLISSFALASDFPALDETALAPISEIVNQAVSTGRIPGAVVLIGSGDKVVFRKAFGWRSLHPDKTPMTEDVIFDTASLTKVIATTTAVMQLVEHKKLMLDAPAATYWPEFRKHGKGRITLRHLLTHYSGLRTEPKLGPHVNGYTAALKAIVSEKPLHPPGQVLSIQRSQFHDPGRNRAPRKRTAPRPLLLGPYLQTPPDEGYLFQTVPLFGKPDRPNGLHGRQTSVRRGP